MPSILLDRRPIVTAPENLRLCPSTLRRYGIDPRALTTALESTTSDPGAALLAAKGLLIPVDELLGQLSERAATDHEQKLAKAATRRSS